MLCCELFLGKPGPLVPGPGADSPIQKLEIQKSISPAVAGRKATPQKIVGRLTYPAAEARKGTDVMFYAYF